MLSKETSSASRRKHALGERSAFEISVPIVRALQKFLHAAATFLEALAAPMMYREKGSIHGELGAVLKFSLSLKLGMILVSIIRVAPSTTALRRST